MALQLPLRRRLWSVCGTHFEMAAFDQPRRSRYSRRLSGSGRSCRPLFI